MGRWSDLAEWRGPTPNQGGAMREQRGLVVHIAEGYFEGTIAWQRNDSSNVSSHFIVAKDGRIAQMVDTDMTAWTQSAGNGKWLSVENEGFTPNALAPQQIEANAQLLARGHLVYGYPLQIAVNPDGRGLGHHSMGCNWPGGAWGHCDCPGPAIIAQKQQILSRAIGIVNGVDDMEQTDPLIGKTNSVGRTIGNALADVSNLRDAMIGAGAAVPGSDGWPQPGSPLDHLVRLPELVAEKLTAGQLDAIAVKAGEHAAALVGGKLDALFAVMRAELRDAVADLGEGGAAKVRADEA